MDVQGQSFSFSLGLFCFFFLMHSDLVGFQAPFALQQFELSELQSQLDFSVSFVWNRRVAYLFMSLESTSLFFGTGMQHSTYSECQQALIHWYLEKGRSLLRLGHLPATHLSNPLVCKFCATPIICFQLLTLCTSPSLGFLG
jgi:hypothetical protein